MRQILELISSDKLQKDLTNIRKRQVIQMRMIMTMMRVYIQRLLLKDGRVVWISFFDLQQTKQLKILWIRLARDSSLYVADETSKRTSRKRKEKDQVHISRLVFQAPPLPSFLFLGITWYIHTYIYNVQVVVYLYLLHQTCSSYKPLISSSSAAAAAVWTELDPHTFRQQYTV